MPGTKWVTRQAFNETPDGVQTIFTTSQDFELNSLYVTHGGQVVTNYSYTDNHTIQFDAAPDPALGGLLWAGLLSFGLPGAATQFPAVTTLTGPWDASLFLQWYRYDPEWFLPTIEFVNWDDYRNFIDGILLSAEQAVQLYLLSTNFWARGIADPVASGDEQLAEVIKEAIALTAQKIFNDQHGVAAPTITNIASQSVSFEGAGSTSFTFRGVSGEDAGILISYNEGKMLDALFQPFISSLVPFGKVIPFSSLPDQVTWNQ